MTPLRKYFIQVTLGILITPSISSAWADTTDNPININENTIRVGISFLHFTAEAPDLSGTGIGSVPPGTNLAINPTHTAYFSYIRRLSPHFDLEAALGYPPTTPIIGKGNSKLGSVPYAGQNLGSADWIAPVFLINYKFFEEESPFRPFVGLGVNYTHFSDLTTTPAGNAAFGGPTVASATNSIGPAADAGVVYRLNERWSLWASYALSQVKSTITTNTSGINRTTNVNFHPESFTLSAGYSF